jgi:hypothetical protein
LKTFQKVIIEEILDSAEGLKYIVQSETNLKKEIQEPLMK